ncbi:MAG: hypothetical protein ABSH50_14230 [Bryobacteraceae bacterium]
MLPQQLQRIVPGFARVYHDRLGGSAGQFHLRHEDVALHVARRKVVMVVQADFAYRHHFGFVP